MVYSCLEDKMFTARRGKGAFCNGERLKVSEQEGQFDSQLQTNMRSDMMSSSSNHLFLLEDIKQSIIATEFGSNRDPEVVDKIFSSLRNVLCIPVHG